MSRSLLNKEELSEENKNSTDSIYVNTFVELIALLLCGIPAAISNYRSKNQIKNQPIKANKSTRKHCLLCGIWFIIVSAVYIQEKLKIDKEEQFSLFEKILQVLMCITLCFFVFKEKIYRHHIISIIICIFLSLSVSIYNIIVASKLNENSFGSIIFYYLLYASREVYERWIINKKFVYPYHLLFVEGLIGALGIGVICIIRLIFSGNMFKNIVSIITDNLIRLCFLLLVQILLEITRIMTINYFSPTHRYVADILVYFYFCIEEIIKGNKYYFHLFCLLFIIVGILIYHEVLIIHLCGMEQNTQENIDKRAENDQKDIEDLLTVSIINDSFRDSMGE